MTISERSYTNADASYRFGFNGKESDNEVSGNGNQYDYGFRIYNPRLGRFLSVDPLSATYPWYTPYQFAGNKPIIAIDLDGLEDFIVIRQPNPTNPELIMTTIYKIDPNDANRKTLAGYESFGNGGVEYRTLNSDGTLSTKKRVADFEAGSIEESYMNGEINTFGARDENDEGKLMKRRDVMTSRPLDQDGNPSLQFQRNQDPLQNRWISKTPEGNPRYLSNGKLFSIDLKVYFDTDRTEVNRTELLNYDEAVASLNNAASVIKKYTKLFSSADLNVRGSFDIRTSKYKDGCGNKCLSADRATNIATYLNNALNQNNPDNTIIIGSYGIEQNNAEVVDDKDRSAQLVITITE